MKMDLEILSYNNSNNEYLPAFLHYRAVMELKKNQKMLYILEKIIKINTRRICEGIISP